MVTTTSNLNIRFYNPSKTLHRLKAMFVVHSVGYVKGGFESGSARRETHERRASPRPLVFLACHECPKVLVMQAIRPVHSVKRDRVYRDKLAETATGVLLLIT